MLKSRFDLSDKPEVEEEEPVATTEPEEAIEAEALDEGEEAKTPVIVYPDKTVKKAEICSRLGFLGKTAEGDGYTYLKLDCSDMELTNVDIILSYKHLQFVNVSKNNLTLNALQVLMDLPYLVLLHADFNLLNSAGFKRAKYLQVLILNNNQITSVHDVYQPELSTLEIGYNKISRIYFTSRMPELKVLDFRYNIITDILELDFPHLDSLYLAGNKIKSLLGISRLVNLRILHLRFNPIKNLDGFDLGMTKLQYLNLRNCKIKGLKQLKKLRVLKGLDTLILKGCPYMGGTGEEDGEVATEEEDPEIRVEVLAALPRLKRLNKTVYTPEERTEAKDLQAQWLEEGEKDDEEDLGEEFNEEESSPDE